jgi:membrane-associated protease RseP (regulator of RpoE activity)
VTTAIAQPGRAKRERYWLHALLLLLTLLTTTAVGARLSYNFERNRPALFEEDLLGFSAFLADPGSLIHGLPFSLTLITILMAHELGHYLTCAYYGIDASLPYFLPAPTLIGTLGAFIRIRAPIFSKRQLFDVGIAGPLAGFAFVCPALAIGLAYSKIIPGIVGQGDVIYGTPLLLRTLEWLIFPEAGVGDIYLHPVARAAWVGVLATALNLMPIGQLDGGHILYALVGDRHRLLTRVFIAALVPLGWYTDSWSWWVWAALLLFFGMRHPRIYDDASIGAGRAKLALLALLIFIGCISVNPIHTDWR